MNEEIKITKLSRYQRCRIWVVTKYRYVFGDYIIQKKVDFGRGNYSEYYLCVSVKGISWTDDPYLRATHFKLSAALLFVWHLRKKTHLKNITYSFLKY